MHPTAPFVDLRGGHARGRLTISCCVQYKYSIQRAVNLYHAYSTDIDYAVLEYGPVQEALSKSHSYCRLY